MRIGLYQSKIVWENKEENLCKLEKRLKRAVELGADAIFLPEMSFTGFSMNTQYSGEDDYYTVDNLARFARDYSISIGFGWVKHKIESENHYTVVNKWGEVIFDYTKIHPFSFSGEDKSFVSGDDLGYFELEGIRFSALICYDLRFPSIFEIVARKSDIIIVPANWPAKRSDHWKCLLKARAIENQVYVAGVNCVGMIGGLEYNGCSCLFNPNGDIVESCAEEEKLIIADIKGDVSDYRDVFPTYKDKKTALYRKLDAKYGDIE